MIMMIEISWLILCILDGVKNVSDGGESATLCMWILKTKYF